MTEQSEQDRPLIDRIPSLEETKPTPPPPLSDIEAAFLCYKVMEVGRPDWQIQQIARAGFKITDPTTGKIVYVVATEVQEIGG